jgi:signal transduction histidine kinase
MQTPEAGESRSSARQDIVYALSRRIIRYANRGTSRADFLGEVVRLIRDCLVIDDVEVWLNERGRRFCARLQPADDGATARCEYGEPAGDEPLAPLIDAVLRSQVERGEPAEPIWLAEPRHITAVPLRIGAEVATVAVDLTAVRCSGVALVPFFTDATQSGVVLLRACREPGRIRAMLPRLAALGEAIGIAALDRHAQAALRERVKELACLYDVARLLETPTDEPPAVALQRVVDRLPSAWLHADIAACRLTLDDHRVATANFDTGGYAQQFARLVIHDAERGRIELVYLEPRPDLDEGPFLIDERRLLDSVARDIARAIERRESTDARRALEAQLRHADRLATLGQLAAGVAHELNEPLNTVLGFGQLLQKAGLGERESADLQHIVDAALHAREVIRKLMLFAREAPADHRLIALGNLIDESLFFFEARCQKRAITLDSRVEPDTPPILGDLAQLKQVLVNLVVNAMQATPEGGRIEVIAGPGPDGGAELRVADSGEGIPDDVMARIFEPFFTTKDVHEGTGLGLSVVHGIVKAHRADIDVDSRVGAGTTFTIRFPAPPAPTPNGATAGVAPS